MRKLLLSAALLFSVHAHSLDLEQRPEVAKQFEQAGVSGTFVLYDVTHDRFSGHDAKRAATPFIPASTFKIVNSLIGLSQAVVTDVDTPLPYGGKPQPFKAWERDMGLREAMQLSNVPIYQELARRIGLKRMREGVELLGYGNALIGDQVDDFWLVGPLQISAIEQTRFLARLARDQLPLPKPAQQQVREITLIDQGDGWELHGKTGWNTHDQPNIGWWVGWLEQDGRIYSFALNIDMPDDSALGKRVELGRASLKALGLP